MAKRQYTIYLDESSKRGAYFSNFYGGALVRSADRQAIESALEEKAQDLNLHQELKWTKVTQSYLEKYIDFTRFFFEFVRSGRVKIRIMFCQNFYRPTGLTREQIDLGYFLLYYQLVKHGFGIQHCNPNNLDRIYFELLFDALPDTEEKSAAFKQRLADISGLFNMRGRNLNIPRSRIGEVDSKDHRILQGLDIILGSMHFRLNDLHKAIPEGKKRRGKRTVAKERLYKEINSEIQRIYPNFNVGTSTGTQNGPSDRWDHHYRHWLFRPKNHVIDRNFVKGRPR